MDVVKPFIIFHFKNVMSSEQIDGEEFLICNDCKKPLEKCMCVCPYCGERDKCECVLFDAATGG